MKLFTKSVKSKLLNDEEDISDEKIKQRYSLENYEKLLREHEEMYLIIQKIKKDLLDK